MEFLTTFASLFSNFGNLTWQMVVMWAVGGLLIYLAIAKQMEPSLLLPTFISTFFPLVFFYFFMIWCL